MTQNYSTPEIKRGQVWYIDATDPGPVISSSGRPGVVVSSDYGNSVSPIVQVCYMTMTPRSSTVSTRIWNPRKQCDVWVLGNQIATISKQALRDLMYAVTETELAAIDKTICVTLGLQSAPSVDVSTYEAKIKELEETIDRQKLELVVAQKSYEKVLDRLVEKKIETDIAARSTSAPVEQPVVIEETPMLVDINRCTERELMNLGFSFSVARNITAARPFLKLDDLRIVPGITRMAFGIVEKKITLGDISEYLPSKKESVVEEAVTRVNINTCDYKELMEVAGASKDKAWAITGYRRQHGPYGCVDDIINARGMTQKWIDKHRDKLEV